ncbi:uncharacterized protein LOC106755366 isoform X1 [Vigna radiata var. radiata]|uniref:SREBP regulating gene protein n=1 Tax=Vigna radiata var. radiata TaxID=3916 RepID=A0A3Q0EUG7_VIGRR|nr:uncharacterized protein LOC106755366 isoform X1 [Vigna radiata var. radiata]
MEVCASSSSRRIYLLILFIFNFSPTITAIRKDVSFQTLHPCKTTVQGRYLLSDENGYVCNAVSVNSRSRCCPPKGEKFSLNAIFFHNAATLMNIVFPAASILLCLGLCIFFLNLIEQTSKEQVLKMKVAKPATARTYTSVFDYCAGRCRHSSESVVHENAYISDFHHCFSLPSNSSSGKNSTLIEARLNGINVVVGRQGESCNSVCKSRGQLCVPNKLAVLNNCDIIQKYMSCKGSCLSSVGSDQPAEVVYDAPMHLNPGSCLYTETVSMLSCDGLHQHTRRLCPCA